MHTNVFGNLCKIINPIGYDNKKWNHVSQNARTFTSFEPKDPKDAEYWTLTKGMFKEVWEPTAQETYGHYTLTTATGKLKTIYTTNHKGQLIDPVAFAYDFGARIYDARVGRFLSVDPLQMKFPYASPYAFCLNKPIMFIDYDGRDIIPSNQFMASRYYSVALKMICNLDNLPSVNKYIAPFLAPNRNVQLNYHNFDNRREELTGLNPNNLYGQAQPLGNGNYRLNFNSIPNFNQSGELGPSDGDKLSIGGNYVSEIGMFNTMIHEFIHTAGVGHEQMASPKIRAEMKQAVLDYSKLTKTKISAEQADALVWVGLEKTQEFTKVIGGKDSETYKSWLSTIQKTMWGPKSSQTAETGRSEAALTPKDETPQTQKPIEKCE